MEDENDDLDEIESFDNKGVRLQRGFSQICNNINLVVSARRHVLQQINEDPVESLSEKSVFTFILPNLHNHPEDFKAFLFKDLIDSSVLVSLEQEGDLNWWTDRGICGRLLPMVTSGDGNCLLHAASLAMWGFHDRVLALRTALHQMLNGGGGLVDAFKRRWYHEKNASFKAGGLQLDKEEWEKEWKVILSLSSPTPRSDSMLTYESLEEIHIFVLCHVIRRPIIVFASPFLKNFQGQNIAPVPFRGIYLPMQIPPEQCCKSPLLLVYNHNHFNALCPVQEDSFQKSSIPPILVPLVDKDLHLLPVHFVVDPSRQSSNKDSVRSLLNKYMNIHEVFVNNLDGSLSLKRRRKSSVQSTKYVSTSFEQSGLNLVSKDNDEVFCDKPLQTPSSILAARLNVVKAPFADEIVRNYMASVEKSFANLSKIRSKVNNQIITNNKNSPKSQKSSGKDFNNLNRLTIECDETNKMDIVGPSKLNKALKHKNVDGFDGNQEFRMSQVKSVEKDAKSRGHYLIGYDYFNEHNDNAYSMSLNRNFKIKAQDYVDYDQKYCDYNNNEKKAKNFLKDYRLVQPNISSNQSRNQDVRFSEPVKDDFAGVSATLQKFFTSGRPKEGKVADSFVHIGNSKFYADICDNLGTNHNNKTDDLDDNVLNNDANYNNNNNNDYNYYEKEFKNGSVEPDFSTFPLRSSAAKHNKKSIFTSATNKSILPTHVHSKSNLPPSSSSHNFLPSRPPLPQQLIKQDPLNNAKQTAETKSQDNKPTLKQTPVQATLCSSDGCIFEASIKGKCRICWVEEGNEQSDGDLLQSKASYSLSQNHTKSYNNTNNVFPCVYSGKHHGAFDRNDKKRIVEKPNSDRSAIINAKDKTLNSDSQSYRKTKL